MSHRLPTGANPMTPLNEFIVTETIVYRKYFKSAGYAVQYFEREYSEYVYNAEEPVDWHPSFMASRGQALKFIKNRLFNLWTAHSKDEPPPQPDIETEAEEIWAAWYSHYK